METNTAEIKSAKGTDFEHGIASEFLGHEGKYRGADGKQSENYGTRHTRGCEHFGADDEQDFF